MTTIVSHPVWVRGLKLGNIFGTIRVHLVAPRVGAWIETNSLRDGSMTLLMSHPVWVRGLKLPRCPFFLYMCKVAPRVGAWIETCSKL